MTYILKKIYAELIGEKPDIVGNKPLVVVFWGPISEKLDVDLGQELNSSKEGESSEVIEPIFKCESDFWHL